MQEFKTVEVTTDLLIIGPGMAGCGACVEGAHWAKENGLKITVVDKAAMERSGAVGMGLSAINQYQGENTPVDYLSYVRQDLMGLCRDDLVMDISRHVNGSVHLFEGYGLPLWKDENGNYVHEGRWQLMINGESYKAIVAEAAAHDELIPLRHMGTQASGLARDAIHLWYAEAYSLVAFIADVYGEEKLGQVILTLADNHPIEDTLQLVLGMDLIEFEMAWRSWLGYPVDVIPTPVRIAPTMISPVPLSTVPYSEPTATLAPTPVSPVAEFPTSTPPPTAVSPSFPCCISTGAVLVAALLWILIVRWRFT